ncbi:thiosulfate/3-mercaptopyruvate sulfurtransferase [Actinopolymorpha cephalotaxi]|uniref:Thiosulfate/3-mercaptopyruvate sulfurtransferase n=1 Tax=Actinopolymorpha cephalotaxi TaxID=504797 RepID=A0A1I2PPU1_9ACTN|nr:sulfurtransferase [Actinopolymorpha cephalotaxi]NYH83589.1 thiosulfate/3-mercaptopyruvate sulfurtransferase [Actinopolymorpha cephalotaxi]SFG16047.1 thiosulfate/3-mercaptopyruvate sulfurtransferase [Actinopolymorpha cephalotaxi]
MSPILSVPDLVTWLAGDQPPVVLDVRWTLAGPPAPEVYRAGHVPGARYVDFDTVLSGPADPAGGGRHPLPSAQVFTAAMRDLGVRTDSDVVVYGAPDGFGAARAWWCLRYFGHRSVRVLDGGFAAWAGAGQPVETGEQAPVEVAGDFTARPGGMPVLDVDEAARLARSGLLLDARAGERYRGETEPVDPVGGHIPGALSAPTAANLDADGRLLDATQLRERFAALGIDSPAADVPGQDAASAGPDPAEGGSVVGTYCGSGVSAAQQVLALELAGVRAGLYVGSWSDWVSDRRRPVATGPDRG